MCNHVQNMTDSLTNAKLGMRISQNIIYILTAAEHGNLTHIYRPRLQAHLCLVLMLEWIHQSTSEQLIYCFNFHTCLLHSSCLKKLFKSVAEVSKYKCQIQITLIFPSAALVIKKKASIKNGNVNNFWSRKHKLHDFNFKTFHNDLHTLTDIQQHSEMEPPF